MDTTTQVDRYIDAKGQVCPTPILMLAKAMRDLQAGQVVEIIATDAGAKADIPAWCEKTGAILLDSTEQGGTLTFHVRKTA